MSSIANKYTLTSELKGIIGRVKWNSQKDSQFFSEQSQRVEHLYDDKTTVDDILQLHLVHILKSVLTESELVPEFLKKKFQQYIVDQSMQDLIAVRCNQFLISLSPHSSFSSVEEFITIAGINAIAESHIVDDFCSRVKTALNEMEESCDSS